MDRDWSVSRAWATLQITYAQLESSLVEIYSVDQSSVSKLRARYKHFQKLGLPARRPGTGNRVKFDINEFCQILLAMELSEFGLDPILIRQICNGFIYDFGDGHSVLSEFSREMTNNIVSEVISEMRYLVFEAKSMSYRWSEAGGDTEFSHLFPHSIVSDLELKDHLKHRSSASVINLTILGKRAYQQLKKYVVHGNVYT